MRLLIATPLYPPDSGGPATYAKALGEGLSAHGIDVSLVKFGEVRHKPKVLRHVLYFWNVYQAARGTDLVLALDPVSVGLPALIAARLRRVPFVVKVVGDYAWEQGRQRFRVWLPLEEFVRTEQVSLPVHMLRMVETFVAEQARCVIVPSLYLKGIVTAWGIEEEKIVVIENAQPAAHPGTLPETLAHLPSPRIVTAGRLVPWKGVHGVIASMVEVRERIPGAHLVIVGDGPEREALERYAASRLKEGYTFTGALPHDEALAVIQHADIFVLNSSYEGLSHILLEALTLGKAIVATKAGGNPEVIEHGKNGHLISIGDTDALTVATLTILKDPAYRASLEGAAKESSLHYAPERMLEATATLLTSLV
jgi:glycosyltransferase involved in cell wall biosynthesis